MDRTAAQKKVLQRGWLSAQAPGFQNAVFRHARLISFPTGSLVVRLGDDVGGIYGVVEGGVGIHVPQADQSLMLAHIARCGVWFGHGPLLTRRHRVLEFSILEPSLLFHVPLALLDEIASTTPDSARALFSISEYGMDIAIATIATLQIRNVERRVAATLLRVAPPQDVRTSAAVEIAVTQSQLGEMANVARDVVNRALSALEEKGWLKVSYRRVTLLDIGMLTGLAAGDEPVDPA